MKMIAFITQFLFELGVIFNNTIVDHCQLAAGRGMGMGITIVRFAVGCPPGMAYPDMGMKVFSLEGFFEVGYLALFLMNLETAVEQCNTSTVVAPVFQSFKAFQDNWIRFTGTDVSNNATHRI